MREIEFRGKNKKGDWFYGSYHYSKDNKNHYIINLEKFMESPNENGVKGLDQQSLFSKEVNEIIPETIGQYLGLKDKNRTKIFEGDVVIYTLNHDSSQRESKSIIEWHNHAWRLNRIWLLTEIRFIEVIGNLHDNPELLKGE